MHSESLCCETLGKCLKCVMYNEQLHDRSEWGAKLSLLSTGSNSRNNAYFTLTIESLQKLGSLVWFKLRDCWCLQSILKCILEKRQIHHCLKKKIMKIILYSQHTMQHTVHSLDWITLTCWVWAIDSCHNHSTYGCDDSSSKEEGTTQIPVAGVVGGITNRIHSGIHSLHRVLGREVETEAHKKSLVSLWSLGFCVTVLWIQRLARMTNSLLFSVCWALRIQFSLLNTIKCSVCSWCSCWCQWLVWCN